MFKSLKIILCCDATEGIGFKNKLPWNIPEEMNLFREKTIGNGNNCVIMGRATFESIPSTFRPLKKRHHFILSRDKSFFVNHPNITILDSFESLLEEINKKDFDDYWVIGGKSIYETVLTHPYVSYISEIHVSILHDSYECDTFLNNITKIKDHDSFVLKEKKEYELFTHSIICRNKDCL